jgi:lipopolysaccharide transport system ATP-binding protein
MLQGLQRIWRWNYQRRTSDRTLPLDPTITIPTIFHITHHKAGSQWVLAIFHSLAYHHLVLPETDNKQFLNRPIQKGKIYPTLYITHEEFHSINLPNKYRHFIIIRDLRDTLISLYFSCKYSHPILKNDQLELRKILNSLNLEDGLLYLAEKTLIKTVNIQWSWVAAREKLYRYEDLLLNDEKIYEEIFIDICRLPLTPQQIREAVRQHRFEVRTQGRPRGVEDVHAHERKGISGDWKNYFTDKVIKYIKANYGSLLIATGYENKFIW